MNLKRDLAGGLARGLEMFPAVLVTGPRQAGKTTLVRDVLPQARYITFDDLLNQDFARTDPQGLLGTGKEPCILDEIQRVPELLPYLKMRIDHDRCPGHWLLTGSQQFLLMRRVSESLAGRIAILELPPFSLSELAAAGRDTPLEQVVWNGLFPEPCLYPERRDLWAAAYVQTYVERDIRQLEHILNLAAFTKFLQLLAAWHAQEFNASSCARDCGVSSHTIGNWLRLLEAGYLVFSLRPYHTNFGKRVIKSPKVYLTDPLLVSYLTRQPGAAAAVHGAAGGALFEGLLVTEAWKAYLSVGKQPDLYYWRSSDGLEVDLLVGVGGQLVPVEIKLNATPSASFMRPIERFKEFAGKAVAKQGILVCQAETEVSLPHGNLAMPWQQFGPWLRRRLS